MDKVYLLSPDSGPWNQTIPILFTLDRYTDCDIIQTMKITNKPKETFMNIILVKGKLAGMFKSHVYWPKLGSKRAIYEYLYNKYEPETDIDIICQNENGITVLEEG